MEARPKIAATSSSCSKTGPLRHPKIISQSLLLAKQQGQCAVLDVGPGVVGLGVVGLGAVGLGAVGLGVAGLGVAGLGAVDLGVAGPGQLLAPDSD